MYRVETISVNGGLILDAHERAAGKLEEKLNAGAKKGWKLHSVQESNFMSKEKGMYYLIIWEIEEKNTGKGTGH